MSGGCICRGVAGSGIWHLSNDSRQLPYRPVVMGNYKRCNKETVMQWCARNTQGPLIDRVGENQDLPEPYEIDSGSGSRVFSVVVLVLCFNKCSSSVLAGLLQNSSSDLIAMLGSGRFCHTRYTRICQMMNTDQQQSCQNIANSGAQFVRSSS